jgi:hypothetical protein
MTPPRTPGGPPGPGGVWTNSTIAPLERPAGLAGEQFFSKEKTAAYEQKTAQQSTRDRRDGPAGDDPSPAWAGPNFTPADSLSALESHS